MSERKRLKLSNGRRLICDLMRLAAKTPTAGVLCDLDLRELSDLRRQLRPRLAWNVFLMKAYARVASRHPELRQAYVGFPWPHLYQHNGNVCMMAVSREYQNEHRLFFARFNAPESRSLLELQDEYERFRTAPVESIKQFRHQIRFARCPGLLRRLGWWILKSVWVRKSASHIGTFGMSISGFKNAFGTRHLSPTTTTLGVDVICRGGVGRTLLTFDHRVIDGKPVVDVLDELGRELRGAIADEVRQLLSEGKSSSSCRAA